MKKLWMAGSLFLLIVFALYAGGHREPPPQAAPAPTVPASPFYTGDGGKGISIAILAPDAEGLTKNFNYLPALVQGEFVSNFSTYSALSVLDRLNLDKLFDEIYSEYYPDDEEGVIRVGHLTKTDYIMTGIIIKTSAGYALQMQIASSADGMTKASYSGTCTAAELENLTGIRRASLELLEKMGITPSERTRTELAGAAAANHLNAQTALSQGITAQRSGTEVAALSYYIQSNSYDPRLAEAASRLNVLSANISTGNIGKDARNDLEWRDRWVARLRECEEWLAEYMSQTPPCYLVYTTTIQQGQVNYQNRTVPLSITARVGVGPVLQWYKTANEVVQLVRRGLLATGRAAIWGLGKWAASASVSKQNPFSPYVYGFTAVFEIMNSEGRILGSQTMSFPYGSLHNGVDNVAVPINTADTEITFPGVDPYGITDRLTIGISSIDGQSVAAVTRHKNISIITAREYPSISGQVSTFALSAREGRNGIKHWENHNNRGDYWTITVIPYGTTSLVSGDFIISRGYQRFRDCVVIHDTVSSIVPSYSPNGYDLVYVSIGANVHISESAFPKWFSNFYDRNGKRAGIYTDDDRRQGNWIFNPR